MSRHETPTGAQKKVQVRALDGRKRTEKVQVSAVGVFWREAM